MANWTITLPAAVALRVVQALAKLRPIPMTEPGPGSNEAPEPRYTEPQWAKMQVKEWLRRQVQRAEQRTKIDEARLEVDISDLNIQVEG